MDRAAQLREQAARARYYASVAPMEDDRAAWLAIAARWETLAEQAEKEFKDPAGD